MTDQVIALPTDYELGLRGAPAKKKGLASRKCREGSYHPPVPEHGENVVDALLHSSAACTPAHMTRDARQPGLEGRVGGSAEARPGRATAVAARQDE